VIADGKGDEMTLIKNLTTKFCRGVPFVCSVILLGSLSTVASAQDDSVPADEPAVLEEAVPEEAVPEEMVLEEVVVMGIRGALENALKAKRASDNLVEIVNAEDVGKMPDQNLAEVLENIPGVQIDRTAGVGSSVSIRGSDQNRIELNGRGTTPAEDDRGGISFEDMPAELIASLEVVKVPTADMVEGSLGGTINLKTYRPLKLKKPLRALSLRYEYAENRGEYTPSFSGTYANKFSTKGGDIGLLLSAIYSARQIREDTLNVRVGARTNQDLDGDGVNDPYLRPQFAQQFFGIQDQTNLAINTSFEWQASDEFRVFVDGTYTEAEIDRRGFGAFLGLPGSRAELDHLDTAVFSDYTAPNGVSIPMITRSQIDGVQIRSTNSSLSRETDSSVVAMGGEFLNDAWTIAGELSASGSDTYAPQFSLVTQFQNPDAANINSAAARQRVDFLYDITGGDLEYGPVESFAGDLLDPNSYATFVARDTESMFDNTDNAQRIDFTYHVDNSFVSALQFGVRTNQRESKRGRTVQNTTIFPGLAQGGLYPFMTSTPGDFFDFNPGGRYLDAFLAGNPDLFKNPTAIREELGLATDPSLDRTQSFIVTEDTLAAYLVVNFNTDLGGVGVRGNLGVRYIDTDQSAKGFQLGDGFPPEGQAINVKQKYSETLPSMSMVIAPRDDLLVRIGGARILRRPNFGDLSPTVVFPLNNNAVTQGNPALQPTTADQYDLTFEYYFRPGSLLSLGAFYKNIDGTIGSEIVPGGIYNPNATAPDGTQGEFVDLIRPVNVAGGKIKGFELSFQHNFDHLSGFWKNFGMIANYTYQDGKRDATFTIPGFIQDGEQTEFPLNFRNLSENSYNLTLFYETDRFDARVRYTYRDAFLRREALDLSNGLPFYQGDRGQLNANMSYSINDIFLIHLSGINLTKETNDEYGIFADGPLVQMRDADRRIVLGVRARF